MRGVLEKSVLFLGALIINLGLYLLVPYIQILVQHGAARRDKASKTVIAQIDMTPPAPEKLVRREIKPIRSESFRPPTLSSTRPSTPGGGLKIDLSVAGGEGPSLVSGGDRSGPLGSGTGGGQGLGLTAMTYDPGQTDTDAKPIGPDPPLDFPARAERDGVNGRVDLTFVVNESGMVEQISIIKEEPTGYNFAAAAMASARKMRFKPATLQKMAVRQRFKRTFNFQVQ